MQTREIPNGVEVEASVRRRGRKPRLCSTRERVPQNFFSAHGVVKDFTGRNAQAYRAIAPVWIWARDDIMGVERAHNRSEFFRAESGVVASA